MNHRYSCQQELHRLITTIGVTYSSPHVGVEHLKFKGGSELSDVNHSLCRTTGFDEYVIKNL